jgi:hypothetical protein
MAMPVIFAKKFISEEFLVKEKCFRDSTTSTNKVVASKVAKDIFNVIPK